MQTGAQKSHTIPQDIYKTKLPDLFQLIKDAKLPGGALPFDPDNFLDNGQALPSDNSGAVGRSVIDAAQHNGSHPQINQMAERRLRAIYDKLEFDLAAATTPEAKNLALVEANAKVRNIADTLAAISIGGIVDPAHPELRAVYNRTDPNARILWPDWDTLTDTQKDQRIATNLDNLMGGFVDPSGALTPQGERKMKVLRDLTQGSVGALTPADAQIADSIIAHMEKRGIDPTKVDAAAYLEINKADLVPATGELAQRAEKIGAARIARKIAAKLVTKALIGAFAAFDLYDYADTGGRLAAFARGDAQFAPTFDESKHFSGVDYLSKIATSGSEVKLLGTIGIPSAVTAGITDPTALKAAVAAYLNQHFDLPENLTFVMTDVRVEGGLFKGGTYTVDDTTTIAVEHVQVVWRASSSNGSSGSAILLQRAGMGDVLVVTDTATGESHAYYDPKNEIQKSIERSVSTDPVERARGQTELQSAQNRSVSVTTIDGKPDATSVAQAVELINDTKPVVDEDVSTPEIIVSRENRDDKVVAVVFDGVVHVLRGLGEEIERFVNALAKGPGVLAEDIRNFRASGKGLIDFADIGQILGSQLSAALQIRDPWARIGASTSIGSVLTNLGQTLDLVGTVGSNGAKLGMSEALDSAFKDFGNDILQAGTGAVSSYIVGNLLAELGLNGSTLDAAVAFAGPTVGKIAYNALTGASWNAGLTTGFFATAAATFLGSKLADSIVKFDSLTGQIGAAVGEAIGTVIAVKLFEASLASGNPYAIAAAAIIVAVSKIIGGLIGSLFGDSKSSASLTWSAEKQEYTVGNVTSRRGGSKDAARQVTGSVADALNAVLFASQSKLLVPVEEQKFGMLNSKYVYWNAPSGYGVLSKSENPQDIIRFGTKVGLDGMVGNLAGGDVFVKRALASTLRVSGASNFEVNAIIGDFMIAKDYGRYLLEQDSLHNLILEFPDSAFSASWITTLVRAYELGVDKRGSTDWTGGWDMFLDEMRDGSINGSKWSAGAISLEYREETKERLFGFTDLDGVVNAYISDTIDSSRVAAIAGATGADIIDLRSGQLTNQIGYAVNGHLNNDIALEGGDFAVLTAPVTFAASTLHTSVDVTIAPDTIAEATESFLASLTNAPAMRIMGGEAVAMIIDGAALLSTLMVGDSYAWEDDGYAVFRLSLSKAASAVITVSLALADRRASGAGLDYGSAGAGNLQVSSDGVTWVDATTATFTIGATELFVRTAVVADNVLNPAYAEDGSEPQFLNVEGNERFRLDAAVTAGAAYLANATSVVSGTGTIVDGAGNEPLVWIDDVIVDEATGLARFSLSRSRTLATSTTVHFATSDRRVLNIDVAATVDGGDGNDTIYGSNLGDNLFGGAGNDTLYGGRLDDWLLGGDGDDALDAGTLDQAALGGDGNYLNGGAGNDTLRGREGSDWLEGGEGTDVITGGAGDDILAGGAGDADDLKGGIGADQYLVRLGDGLDSAEEDASGAPVSSGTGDAITQRIAKIEAWKTNPATVGAIRPDWVGTSAGVQAGAVSGGEDSVVFGAGIGIGDIKLQRSGTSGALGNDLIVMVMQTVAGVETFSGTQLTIRDWFTNPFKRVEWLKFIDGNEIRIGDITSFIVGGSGNDVLIGTTGNDFVYGGAGNDKLYLLAGDDIGNGGIGDDMVAGDSGRDLLIGGLGNDELIGGAGSDAITGDAGADDIYGGADRDTLSGGRGDGDMVVGGAGDDTFRYARGDGRDTYFDEFAGYWGVVWTSAGGWNTAGGYAYNATTGEVTGPGGIVIRKNLGTVAEPDFQWLGRYDYDSATQTLKFFAPPVSATTITANAGVDTIEFAPGINLQDVILRRPNGTNDLVLAISSENEELGDTSLARDSVTIRDWYLAPGQIEKLAFYQTGILDITAASKTLIAGTDGADGSMSTPLQGTVGADWITGAAGDDVIAAGTGNDILAGNSGFDTLKGEAGDDVLYGGTGNDMLDGGSGKDVLVGGAGQDTASYASASAAVRAQLSAQWANAGDASGDEYYGIEDLTGGSGADVLGGDSGQNELTGGAGNDSLQGNAGDDTYVWNVGDGADTINEGGFVVQEAVTAAGELAAGFTVSRWEFFKTTTIGQFRWILQITGPDGSIVYTNSTFIYPTSTGVPPPVPASYIQAGWLGGFARTNGQQVTRQLFDPASNGGNDELEFGPNISLNDLTFVQSGNDLIVRYGDSSASQVTIKDQLLAASAIETLKFSDGLSVSLASVLIAASSAQLVGTAGDDLLVGQAGVMIDTLTGGDGNDTLAGYAGNDFLSGGNGDDVLEGGLGADTLDGGAHVVPADGPTVGDTARYVRSAAAVTINLNQTTAQTGAAGADSIGDVLVGIENVTGSAFGDTITGNGADNRLFGLDGADTISGGAGSDVLTGDGGNDSLYGDAGDDNIAGGDGNDTIYGGTENDALDGGDGVDLIFGETGNDSLTGGAGADTLNGGDGDDILSGDADNDSLAGGAGNDALAGGTGSDMLSGGVGNDRYVLGRNSGSDTISDVDGINAIQFDSSVSYNQIWLTRVGNDLRVAVIGGDTVAMVIGFFLAAGGGKIKAIETTTHAIFLDHPDTLNIITAMTAATATPAVSPVSIPTSVAGLLATYWHAGGKAVPTGPATARTFTLAEDGTLAIDGSYGVIDHDQNVVSYAIKTDGGPAKGTISNLNPATGALTYTPFANATGLDSFVVVAIDADGQAVELTVSVSITAVNDAPVSIAVKNGALLVVAESTPAQTVSAGTIIGEFESVDPEGDLLTFALVNDAGQRFALSADGKLSVANPAAIDFEAAASHTIRVRVSDFSGASHEQDFVVNVQNGNEQNLLNAALLSVSENVALGTVVGTMAASDLDISGDYASQRYYFWDGTSAASISADGRYAIDAVTGQITVNSALNFEGAEPSRTYQVIARDNAGSAGYNQAQSAVKISITDLNEVPISLNWTPLIANVAERDRVAAATLRPAISLGTLSVNDPDPAGLPGASYTYGVSDSRFEIVGSTLRLRQNAAFDFETEASVSVTVTGTDQTGSPFTITRVISFVVTDQDDILEGTSGNDTFSGQQGRDIISGFAGNDILNGNAGDDNIDGGDGADQLNGGVGVDTLLGQGGSDIIYGGSEADTLRGGDGDDRLLGEDGHDAIYGDAGSDGTRAVGSESWRGFTQAGLIGGAGNDYLHGGDGDDYLDGGAGADQLIGSLGFDGVDYSASTLAVTVNLTTGTGSGGDAQGDTLSGIELVQGSALGDAITGTAGSDTIYGGAGNDVILGGAGNDYLFGGDGNDTINAEAGDDMLDGGAGDDVLNGGIDNDLYIVTRSSGADTINNYDPSGDDVDVIGFNDAGGAIAHKDLWFERIGNDLKITVIATGSSVQVTNWYTVTDAASRANHKIDFIIAGTSYSKTINIEGLVTLMAGKTKPATLAARDTLMEDLVYKANWATYWDTNAAPVLTAITQQVTNEDTARTFSVTATDDITPNAQVNLSVQVLSGTNVVADADITFGAADANGVRTMTINPADNASGTARIRVTATDAGGVSSSQDFDIVVGGVADTPTVEQFTSPGGTSGYPEGIALNLHVAFPDSDGSESQRIWITGVPAGVTLSAGIYDSASATWKLSVTQLSNLKLLAPAAWSQDITLTATGRATENGQTAISDPVVLTIAVNAPPTGASFSGSVNENAANGTAVASVVGIDPDAGDLLTYSLTDTAGGRFAISNSGAVSVANGTLLNFETTTSHSITVRITDSHGEFVDRSFAIAVSNVNEANTVAASSTFYLDENVAAGAIVGTVAAGDVDSGATVFGQQRYYFWNGASAQTTSFDGRFTIDAVTGVITSNAAFNFEIDPNTQHRVIARDNAGNAGFNQVETQVNINLNNINEANSWPAPSAFAINENVAIGTVLGTVTAFDLDSSATVFGQQRYYFWNGSAASATSSDGRYAIDAVTGQIRTAAALDFEAGSTSVSYTVVARDNLGNPGYSQASTTVTIAVNNLNEANSMPASYSMVIDENVGIGTLVGVVAASDIDSAAAAFGQQRYYFWDGSAAGATSSDGRYVIDAVTGQIRTASAINFEAGNITASYTVIARDNLGNAGYTQVSSTVTIGLQDVNEAHVLASASGSQAEVSGLPPLSTIFDLRSSMLQDPEGRNMTWTFADGSNQNGIWTLSPDGKLSLTAGGVDYETLTTAYSGWVPYRDYSLATQVLAVRAYDGQHSVTGTFTAQITDVNEGPSLGWSPRFIVHDDQSDGLLGTLQGFDPETGNAATSYSISVRSATESFLSLGSSSDVDNTGNPTVWVGADGKLYFDTPSDGEWEGGIRYHPTTGLRSYYQLDYIVDVTMTDASGVSRTESFTITFLKHDTSGILPIVLDLDGDGLELVSYETSTVTFDMDLDGIADRTGWVGADDGMLVLDRNSNGIIDNSLEISFTRDDQNALTDLEGLRAWDTNRNGLLDTGDDDFTRFQIWRDVNQNGISEAGELFSLGTLGITELNLTLNLTGNELVNDTNVIFATSEYFNSDGSSGIVGDVSFAFDPSKVDVDETSSLAAPIVFDLDDDSAGLIQLSASETRFDMNGDGIADNTGWIEAGDAFLALDRNGNGLIDDISEISFVGDKAGAKTDLEGLAAFDTNADGVLDGEDERFVEFKLWLDGNSNGRTDAGELLSLAEAGVTSISLSGAATGETPVAGRNIVFNTGSFTRAGGALGTLLDAGLAFTARSALPEIEFQESTWDGKSKGYRLSAGSGLVRVAPRNANGLLSADAGQLAGAAHIMFKNQTIGMLSTIVIDLDGDGLEAKQASKIKALFDMNGDGVRDDTGWASGGDGMLVIDHDADGAITDVSEISFLSEKDGARNAWEGLAELDNTRDGKLDASDARFGALKVWVDRNGDGISQSDELRSLADLGISEIGLRNFATSDSVKLGQNLALSTATFKWENGVTGTIGNLAMAFTPSARGRVPATRPEGEPVVADIMALRAASNLAQAMSTFGTEASQGDLRLLDVNGNAPQDWLTAAAV